MHAARIIEAGRQRVSGLIVDDIGRLARKPSIASVTSGSR